MPVMGKTKQEVVSQFRSAEILDAARRVFAKKGFDAATVDEIAEAAGLAKGTVYLYFQSKRNIYIQALRRGLGELVEQTKLNMQADPDLRAKIHSFVATLAHYAEDNRDFYRIYCAEFGNIVHPATISKEFRDLHLRQVESLKLVLHEAMDRGEIRPLPVEAAGFTIHDMVRSLIIRRLLGWSRGEVEEDVDFVCDLIWKGIGN